MMHRWILTLCLASACFSQGDEYVQPRQHPFTAFDGEVLQYSLSLRGVTAADADIYCVDSSGTAIIQATIKTRKLTSLLFAIHNTYITVVDTNNLLPVVVKKNIDQRNLKQKMKTRYDRDKNQAFGDNGSSWPIDGGALDLFSMLYHLRILSPGTGHAVAFALDIESQSWIASGLVENGEPIPGSDSRQSTRKIVLHFTPGDSIQSRQWKTDLLTNRIAQENGQLTIHLGPPPYNLPLQLQFGTKGDQVTMRLKTRYRGEQP